jgi:RecJ-like exonuclease
MEVALLTLILMIGAVFLMSRFITGPKIACTRCQGTGHVNERWPDPSKPGGWHRLEGTCPKCKGKGKVPVR